MLKDHGLSQDDEKKGLEEVQKLTDLNIKGDRRSAEEERHRTPWTVVTLNSQLSGLNFSGLRVEL